MDKEQRQEIEEKFKLLDANGDGQLDAEELLDMLVPLGEMLDINDWKLLFNEMDSNSDGKIQLKEFLDFVFEVREGGGEDIAARVWAKLGVSDEQVKQMAKTEFEAADKGKKGYLDKKEMAQVMRKCCTDIGITVPTDAEVNDAMKLLDANKNNKLSLEEFQPFIRQFLEMKAETR